MKSKTSKTEKSTPEDGTITLLKITRSESEQIVVQRKVYKGVESIDVRTHWKPNDKKEYVPTKKGVSIPIDKAEKMARRILKSLREYPPSINEE